MGVMWMEMGAAWSRSAFSMQKVYPETSSTSSVSRGSSRASVRRGPLQPPEVR